MKIKRNILLNPGPATTTDTVKQALVVPDICPREREFIGILEEVQKEILRVVHADEDYECVFFAGSGTAVMDAAVNSTIEKGRKILIVNNGAYGERLAAIARAYHVGCIEMRFEWTQPPDVDLVKKTLIKNEDVSHVALVHHETTTGMLNPVEDICHAARRLGREIVVDAISSFAGIPIHIGQMDADFIMSTSNKCIQGMAGLSFVIARRSSLEKLSKVQSRSFYLNLYRQYRFWKEKKEMPFTPPVQIVYALRQALKEYFEEGENNRYERYTESWKTLTTGLRTLGFRFLLPEELQSKLLTTVLYPGNPNFRFDTLHDLLYEKGFTIYPGKIGHTNTFRIANIGAIHKSDIEDFLRALKRTLSQMGITRIEAPRRD